MDYAQTLNREGDMMVRKIARTTGELQQRLADAIVDLRDGKITTEELKAINAEAGRALKQLRQQLKDGRAELAKRRKGKAG